MIFAPAIAVACLQVLTGLAAVVCFLSLAIIVKQGVAPSADIDTGNLLIVAIAFAVLGTAAHFGGRLIRRQSSRDRA